MSRGETPIEVARSLNRQFWDDGAVCIRNALGEAEMQALLELFEERIGRERMVSHYPDDPGGTFVSGTADARSSSALVEFLGASSLPDLVTALWTADEAWFFYEQVFLKAGQATRRTPWHQDTSYIPITGSHLANIWINFDPVAEQDSLEFVRGSHRGTLYNASVFDSEDDTAPLYSQAELPKLPDVEADRSKWDIVRWAVEPGDVVVFHLGMLHGGAGTREGATRRTTSVRLFGPDAIFDPRPQPVAAMNVTLDTTVGGRTNADLETASFAAALKTLSPGARFGSSPAFTKVRPRARS